MKVLVHPADHGGCGRYRVQWPGEALAAQGHDVTVLTDWTYSAIWRDTFDGPKVIGIENSPDADVVVVQRPLHRNRVEFIECLQALGIAVVVEIDDDFHAIHPKNPAWPAVNPLVNRDKNRDWLMRACDRADLVTVTTPALAARYGAHGRVQIIPNYVPEWYTRLTVGQYTLDNLPPLTGTILGWSGSTLTHPRDLEAAGSVIGEVVDATGAKFHVVGTGLASTDAQGFHIPSPAEALGLREDATATGWLPIEAYPEGLKQLDVGIVPLAPNDFNSAKSCLKMLEMASVGVPSVGSPTPDNVRLAEAGIGWIAKTPDEWRSLTSELLLDHVMREELSIRWREEVARSFTLEANAHRWWSAWSLALENAQRREAA